jgi:hypothetical protein
MLHVNDLAEPNGVDRPIGVAIVVLDDLEYSGSLAPPELGGGRGM